MAVTKPSASLKVPFNRACWWVSAMLTALIALVHLPADAVSAQNRRATQDSKRKSTNPDQSEEIETLNKYIKRGAILVEREFAPNARKLEAARKRSGGPRAGSSIEIIRQLSGRRSQGSKDVNKGVSEAEGRLDVWNFMRTALRDHPAAPIASRIIKVNQLLDELGKDQYRFEFRSVERVRIDSQISTYQELMRGLVQSKRTPEFDLKEFCESKLADAKEKLFVAERIHKALSDTDPTVRKQILEEAQKNFSEYRKKLSKFEEAHQKRDSEIRLKNGDLNREIPKLFSKLIVSEEVTVSDQDFVLMNNDYRPATAKLNCEYQSRDDCYIRIEFRFAAHEPGRLTDLLIDGKYPRFDTRGQMRKFLVNDTQVEIREFRGERKTDLEDFIVRVANLETLAKLEFNPKNNKK